MNCRRSSKVKLIHRRDEFRGAQSSINKAKELEKGGKIEILTQYQLNSVEGQKEIKNISIKHEDGSIKKVETNYVLGFFGLIMKLGPIAQLGIKFR